MDFTECIVPERIIFNFGSLKPIETPVIMCRDVSNSARYFASSDKNSVLKNFVLVCDNVIYDLIGERFANMSNSSIILLGESPTANIETSKKLSNELKKYDGIFILGSSTVLNIAKYAAKLSEKPYFVIPTALSTINYSSSIAILSNENNIKQFFDTDLPSGIYIDLNLIANAPFKLLTRGISESIMHYATEFDFIINACVTETQHNNHIYQFISKYLEKLITASTKIKMISSNATMSIAQCLLACGFAAHYSKGEYLKQTTHNMFQAIHLLSNNTIKPDYHECLIANTMLLYKIHKHIMTKAPVMYGPQKNNNTFNDIDISQFQDILQKKDSMNFRNMNYLLSINATNIKNIFNSIPDIQLFYKSLGINVSYKDLFISRNFYKKSINISRIINASFTALDIIEYSDNNIINTLL